MHAHDDWLTFPAAWGFVGTALGVEVLLAGKLVYATAKHWDSVKETSRAVLAYARRATRSVVSFHGQSQGCQLQQQEVRALRWRMNRQLVHVSTAFMLGVAALLQVQVAFQLPMALPAPLAWTLLGHLIWLSAAELWPRIQRSDLWYVTYSLVQLLYLLPMNSTHAGSMLATLMVFSVFRLPAVVMVNRLYLVILCNLPFVAAIAWRVSMDSPSTSGSYVIAVEVVNLLVVTAVAAVLQDYLSRKVELDMDRSNTASQLGAVRALLQLTCDAVVELDSELRIAKHSRELAAMLLRDSGDRPGSSLKGLRFTELMLPADALRAAAQLTDFRSSHSGSTQENQKGPDIGVRAHAFHTRLVDSCCTRLQTEVLQVMYTTKYSQTCHLVGLRDFTDTKPYAGVHQEVLSDVESPESDPVSPVSESSPRSTITLGRGTLFLDIDVERLLINAACAPLAHLVGAPTSTVFTAPHTQLLLERIHCEGRLLLERGEQPPSRLFSYEDLPACLGFRALEPETICGTMQVFQAQSGLNVLMAFQVAFPSQASPSSSRSCSRQTKPSGRSASAFSAGIGFADIPVKVLAL